MENFQWQVHQYSENNYARKMRGQSSVLRTYCNHNYIIGRIISMQVAKYIYIYIYIYKYRYKYKYKYFYSNLLRKYRILVWRYVEYNIFHDFIVLRWPIDIALVDYFYCNTPMSGWNVDGRLRMRWVVVFNGSR